MKETKLNQYNPHHRLLIACLADFVTEYGYTTRELYSLLDNAKNQLWSALVELEGDKNERD